MRRILLPLLAALFAGWAASGQDSNLPQEQGEDDLSRKLGEIFERAQEDFKDLGEAVRGGASGSSETKEPAASLVNEDLLREHVGFLAADELQGRNAGYAGNDKAADYVSKAFEKAGLKPAGDGGTWFQEFPIGGRKTRNVLGLLEGTDEALRKEIVVVGAHHDHVGSESEGRHIGRMGGAQAGDGIWNGADDNASGTAAVLALAKAFGEGGLRARRSILFMTFSAEEAGLVGSRYYTNHPIAPIEDHVFMLNLDMVGRNPKRPVDIQGVGSDEKGIVRRAIERAKGETKLEAKIADGITLMGGDSDHSSFRRKKVPHAFFFTGFHADYHRVTDHADKIAYDHLLKIVRTSAYLLTEIGNGAERPAFSASGGPGFEFPDLDPESFQPRRRLGVSVAELTDEECEAMGLKEGEGALRVDLVTEDSAAAAGLKEGDVLVEMGGKALSRGGALADLRRRVERAKAGEEVEIVAARAGERVTVKVRWEK